MFTGIVQGLGNITSIVPLAGEMKITIEAGFDWGDPLIIGESIAVSGVCLTVTEAFGSSFTAHVSGETVSRTVMRSYRPGHKVNLERALRLSDRLGGHIVSGHVDCLSIIRERREKDRSIIFTFGLEAEYAKYVIEKGSVTLDGISLTVNQVMKDSFTVNIIPHTADETTLGFKKAGDYVNLETDIIGKYVARLMGDKSASSRIDEKFLAEHGFI